MRCIVSIILFTFTFLTLQSQTPESFIADVGKASHSYKALRTVFNDYMRADSNLAIYEISSCFPYFATREMTFEISHEKYVRYPYHIKLFYKRDKIVYIKVFDGIADKEKAYLEYMDSTFSQKVLILHNDRFKTDFKLSDLYARNSLMPQFDLSDGGFVLFGPSPSKQLIKLFDSILKQDFGEIKTLAASFSPELAAFGATGLYIWQHEYGEIDRSSYKLLQAIQRSKIKVTYYAGGCLIDRQPLCYVTSNKELQHLYEQFLLYKQKNNKVSSCENTTPNHNF